MAKKKVPNAKFDPNRDIHLNTLTLYARATDTKDFPLFFSVITSNVFANYTGYLSNLTGLPTMTSGLKSAVANIDIQHLSGDRYCRAKRCPHCRLDHLFRANLLGKGGVGREDAVSVWASN